MLTLFRNASLLFACAAASHGQILERGPYLQSGGPDSVTLCWRTDMAVDSQVRWGTTPGDLGSVMTSTAIGTEHRVTITGLQPNSTYYYSVGTQAHVLAGDVFQHSWTTSPQTGDPVNARIWVVGDSGTADANAIAVRDAGPMCVRKNPATEVATMNTPTAQLTTVEAKAAQVKCSSMTISIAGEYTNTIGTISLAIPSENAERPVRNGLAPAIPAAA